MITIDNLMEIVRSGGRVKTGVDVYNAKGILLLEKDIMVDKVSILEKVKKSGIRSVPVNPDTQGGLWDGTGNEIRFSTDGTIDMAPRPEPPEPEQGPAKAVGVVEKRINEIHELKKEAAIHYHKAKECIKRAIDEMRQNQGQFDILAVESHVRDLGDFLVESGHPFAYLNREIFAYDDYLLNHSINVCAIGTAILYRFNAHFSGMIRGYLSEAGTKIPGGQVRGPMQVGHTFTCYYPDELKDITLGFFLYDVGKVMVPEELLNKTGRLTPKEFDLVKRHSYEYGLKILERNRIQSAVLKNIVAWHHGPLFNGEKGCYPLGLDSGNLPPYVKICKLADMYDAMTCKRSYNEALNQISAVTEIFRTYVKRDLMLQFILHAFVKSIGIYPPGSIVFLLNGQMAYVLESKGPIVIPFTDIHGSTLAGSPDPMDLGAPETDVIFQLDTDRSLKTPKDVYNLLPEYLRQMAAPA